MNPDLDLGIERIIRAPRAAVWKAWTDPASFEQWWLPAPMLCRVERLEARAGGPLVTSMSEDGVTFQPHMDACFVVVEDGRRTVSWLGGPVQAEPAATPSGPVLVEGEGRIALVGTTAPDRRGTITFHGVECDGALGGPRCLRGWFVCGVSCR